MNPLDRGLIGHCTVRALIDRVWSWSGSTCRALRTSGGMPPLVRYGLSPSSKARKSPDVLARFGPPDVVNAS